MRRALPPSTSHAGVGLDGGCDAVENKLAHLETELEPEHKLVHHPYGMNQAAHERLQDLAIQTWSFLVDAPSNIIRMCFMHVTAIEKKKYNDVRVVQFGSGGRLH